MLKSYRVVGWGGVAVVAHVILVSAQVLLVLTLDFELELDNRHGRSYEGSHPP